MTKFDIAGILITYAEKISKARNTDKVKDFVRELRKELDLRKLENFGASDIFVKNTKEIVQTTRCKNCTKRGTGDCPMEQDYPWISTSSDDFCSYSSPDNETKEEE